MKQFKFLAGSALLMIAAQISAQTPVEVKLIAAFEEDRGWCLDLRGGQNNGAIIGGLHGHTCYTYNGRGPTMDQAFNMENIHENDEFRMIAFDDKCMTLYEPKAGSFISMETCDGRAAQEMRMDATGHIIPEAMPELCLTMHDVVLPGGGGRPLHIMRDVMFDTCDDAIDDRQTWELRAEWTGPQETTAERPFATNMNAPPPGGGGMGMGMGAPPGGQ